MEPLITELIDAPIDEYGSSKPSSERAIKEAHTYGYDVVFPQPDELFIDIDNKESYQIFQRHRDIVEKHIGIASVIERPSKSGTPEKKHLTVKLNRAVSETERLLLQAGLGSDRKRELLGFIQVLNNDPHPTLFLEQKQKALPAMPERKALTDGNKSRVELDAFENYRPESAGYAGDPA